MKRKSTKSIGIIITVILVCALAIGAFFVLQQREEPMPDDEIILIYEHSNWAWGRSYTVFFADTDGEVYAFDSSMPTYNLNDYEEGDLFEKMSAVKEYTDPVATIDKKMMQKIYNCGMKIDVRAPYAEESVAFDAGQTTIKFRNPETGEVIACYSTGDYLMELQDKNAKKLVDIFEKDVAEKFYAQDMARLYTQGDVPFVNIHCGYIHDGMEDQVMYVAEDKEEFFALMKAYPQDLLSGLTEEQMEQFVYFICYTEVSSTGYDLKDCAIMQYDGRIFFIKSKDSVYSGPDELVGEMMDGFCTVALFPKEALDVDLNDYKTPQ